MFLETVALSAGIVGIEERESSSRIADLKFVHWETSWSRPSLSNKYFETFLARPRGTNAPFSFILKALRPEYCGTALGVALIERERAIGSINSQRLLQIVDYAYPRRVSERQATRGYLVFPRFHGHALASIYNKRRIYSIETRQYMKRAMIEISTKLSNHGWAIDRLTPNELFVNFDSKESQVAKPTLLMLFDYSKVYRFASPSIFTERFSKEEVDVSFDPRRLLPPNAFYKPDLHSKSTIDAAKRFLKEFAFT